MGLDIATASLLDGEFGLYEGVDEKRRLERSSTRDPIVTLVGTGGLGKTRTSLQG